MKTTTITISYMKKGNKFDIKQNVDAGTNVYDLVTVMDEVSDSIKMLVSKHLTDHHYGLTEVKKEKLSKKLKIEDLA